jgi:hypothetical protein
VKLPVLAREEWGCVKEKEGLPDPATGLSPGDVRAEQGEEVGSGKGVIDGEEEGEGEKARVDGATEGAPGREGGREGGRERNGGWVHATSSSGAALPLRLTT